MRTASRKKPMNGVHTGARGGQFALCRSFVSVLFLQEPRWPPHLIGPIAPISRIGRGRHNPEPSNPKDLRRVIPPSRPTVPVVKS